MRCVPTSGTKGDDDERTTCLGSGVRGRPADGLPLRLLQDRDAGGKGRPRPADGAGLPGRCNARRPPRNEPADHAARTESQRRPTPEGAAVGRCRQGLWRQGRHAERWTGRTDRHIRHRTALRRRKPRLRPELLQPAGPTRDVRGTLPWLRRAGRPDRAATQGGRHADRLPGRLVRLGVRRRPGTAQAAGLHGQDLPQGCEEHLRLPLAERRPAARQTRRAAAAAARRAAHVPVP